MRRYLIGLWFEEGVDPDEGQGPVVLAVLVEQRLVLDLAALVAGFHGAEDAAAFGEPVEFGEDGRFDEVGEFVDEVGALLRVLVR